MSRSLPRPLLARRPLLGAGLATLAAAAARPGAARAAEAQGRTTELELADQLSADGDERWTTGRLSTSGFRLVGVTWTGVADARVRVRTRSQGAWSGWQRLADLHDGPDRGSSEGRAARSGTQPLWVAPSDGVEVEVIGERPAGARVALVDPGSSAADRRTTPSLRASARGRARKVPQPPLHSRKDWGADESLRGSDPVICRTVQQVHVHHTASGNDYRRSEVPALIRSFYRYHTQSLGWSDIGYNFLVDKFGRAWVGRAGGPSRPVRGAHTLGFNNTSVGIAVIGNLQDHEPTSGAISAIVKLAAWKLDRHGRSPRGKARVYSHGSDKYAKGWVRLKVIDGHRDTNDTACPGEDLYDELTRIRRRTKRRIDRHH